MGKVRIEIIEARNLRLPNESVNDHNNNNNNILNLYAIPNQSKKVDCNCECKKKSHKKLHKKNKKKNKKKNNEHNNNNNQSDGAPATYVDVAVMSGDKKQERQKTRVIKNTANPQWRETFSFDMGDAPALENLRIRVRQKKKAKIFKQEDFGVVSLARFDLVRGRPKKEWLKLDGEDMGELHICITAHDWGREPSSLAFSRHLPASTSTGTAPIPIPNTTLPSSTALHVQLSLPLQIQLEQQQINSLNLSESALGSGRKNKTPRGKSSPHHGNGQNITRVNSGELIVRVNSGEHITRVNSGEHIASALPTRISGESLSAASPRERSPSSPSPLRDSASASY